MFGLAVVGGGGAFEIGAMQHGRCTEFLRDASLDRVGIDENGAVAALGGDQFQFVRIEGTNGGPIGGINDFDLDGLGFANFQAVGNMGAVPEPTTWAMLILGFGMVGGTMRRRGSQSMRLRTA